MKNLLPFRVKQGVSTVGIMAAALSVSIPAFAGWEQFMSLPCTYAHFITSEGVHLVSDLQDEQDGGITYSVDNGQTWVKSEVRDFWFSNFHEVDGYIFATAGACRVARSEDGGRTWDILNYSKTVEPFIDPKALDSTSCYAITSLDGVLYIGDFCGGGILRSKDYGETWESTDRESLLINVGLPELVMDSFYNLTAFNGKIYCFGLYSVHSLDVTNGKETWDVEPINSNFMSSVTVMGDMLIGGRSLMNYGTDIEYLVCFDGTEWGELPRPDTDDNNVRAILADGDLLLTAHHGGPIYVSDNLGQDWHMTEGLPPSTFPLSMVSDEDYVYAAIYSPITTNTASGVWRISKSELATAGLSDATIDSGVRIEKGVLYTGEAAESIELFNISGQRVAGAVRADSLTLSGLPSGIYVYVVRNGQTTKTGKCVI